MTAVFTKTRALTWMLAMIPIAGCAANPATGVASNGGPLRIRYATGTGSYVSNDVVGTDVHRDAQGNEVGSTDHVQAVQHSYQWNEWKYFQARDELDEQDFYRVAGDVQASDEVGRIRATAALKMKIGMPIMIAGVVAGLVLTSVGSSRGDSSLASLGYYGGSLVGAVGGLVWYWGDTEMKNRHHMPMSRADRNADVIEQCDEGRCRSQRGGRSDPPPPR